MDELLARHRKEQKDLQSQSTQKKKSASKKTRKSVNDECARLEEELKNRQEQEIVDLQDTSISDGIVESGDVNQDSLLDSIVGESSLAHRTEDLTLNPSPAAPRDSDSETPQRKPNRQKARLARRAAEQEAIAASAAEEAANLPDLKEHERQRMLEEFGKRGLEEKEVAANGHCMYSALADQMRQLGLDLDAKNRNSNTSADTVQPNDYKTVRQAAAAYINGHQDDFLPFLEEPLENYLDKIRDSGEWGGQLELSALAKAYEININVVQGEGRLEKIDAGQNQSRGDAWLAYYRHGFGLGEHYNSLRKSAAAKEVNS